MYRIKTIITSIFIILLLNIEVFSAPYVNLKLIYDGKEQAYNNEKVYLKINDKLIEKLPLEPIILNDYTLVPAREVLENMGASVNWNKDTQEIAVKYKQKEILMMIDNKVAIVDGELINMDIPPKLINSKTMIPVRFVSENIGLIVEWDEKKREINIKENTINTEISTEISTDNTMSTTQNIIDKKIINISNIYIPNSNERTFKIYAKDSIEKFEKKVLPDGSIAIDIYDSTNSIEQKTLDSVNDFVSFVYIEKLDNNITRFIFKLKNSAINNVFLSEDKKILFVNFGGNPIKKIQTTSNYKEDTIILYFETKPDIEIAKGKNNKSINITIKNIVDSDTSKILAKDSRLIDTIDYSYKGDGMAKIDVSFKEEIDIASSIGDEMATITIRKKGEAMPEDNQDKNKDESKDKPILIPADTIEINKNGTNINIDKILYNDDYLNKKYVLTFDKDISSLFKAKKYTMNNEYVDNIQIDTIKGKTTVTIHTKKITEIIIKEDKEKVYINIVSPKDKYDYIVVIDPGHGGSAPGTSGNGVIEKDINLDIALSLKKYFDNDKNIKAYFTRLEDNNPTFNFRTDMANEVGDIFISIHNNASPNGGGGPNGTETFYLNPNTSDTGLTSKVLATAMQKHMLKNLNSLDRKIKTSNLIVLRNSKIPAVLCEIGFLSNPKEASLLATEGYQKKAAKSIYDGVLEIIGKYPSKRILYY